MKLLVKSTGPHYYQDPQTGDAIEHNRPSVVRKSEFINTLIAAGKLALISAEVNTKATDAEFLKFLVSSENDVKLATESFMSKYAVDAVAEDDTEAKAEAERIAAEAAAEAARVAAEVEAQNSAEAEAAPKKTTAAKK